VPGALYCFYDSRFLFHKVWLVVKNPAHTTLLFGSAPVEPLVFNTLSGGATLFAAKVDLLPVVFSFLFI
jgi:hypothetical protein